MAVKQVRYTKTLRVQESKRVNKIVIRPKIQACTGVFYCTDLQMTEGDSLSGYAPHTAEMLGYSPNPPRYHNGVVRGSMTVIIPNMGGTSTGLDCYIYPLQDTAAESISLAQGAGAHGMTFTESATAGDELALLAEKRLCLKNGKDTPKDGFFQYTAAHDSKHHVILEKAKSARVYFEYREMEML